MVDRPSPPVTPMMNLMNTSEGVKWRARRTPSLYACHLIHAYIIVPTIKSSYLNICVYQCECARPLAPPSSSFEVGPWLFMWFRVERRFVAAREQWRYRHTFIPLPHLSVSSRPVFDKVYPKLTGLWANWDGFLKRRTSTLTKKTLWWAALRRID